MANTAGFHEGDLDPTMYVERIGFEKLQISQSHGGTV